MSAFDDYSNYWLTELFSHQVSSKFSNVLLVPVIRFRAVIHDPSARIAAISEIDMEVLFRRRSSQANCDDIKAMT